MTSISLYSPKSKTVSEVKVPANFSKETAVANLAQAFHVYRERSHTGLPMVQTRGMVSLTTKKMYKQKHTGNARHSSFKAPIFVGGGVTHGPKGVKAPHSLTKALRDLSRSGALNMKLAQKEIAFIDVASLDKTKEAAALVKSTGARTAVVALTATNWKLAKFFRNIENVSVFPWETVNAYPLLKNHMILVDSAIVETEKPVKEVKKVTTVKKITKKS
jgi:large subunit ribosomal protein L4